MNNPERLIKLEPNILYFPEELAAEETCKMTSDETGNLIIDLPAPVLWGSNKLLVTIVEYPWPHIEVFDEETFIRTAENHRELSISYLERRLWFGPLPYKTNTIGTGVIIISKELVDLIKPTTGEDFAPEVVAISPEHLQIWDARTRPKTTQTQYYQKVRSLTRNA